MIYRELNEHDTDAFLNLKRIGLTANPEAFVASLDEDADDYPKKVRARIRDACIENGDIILGAFDPGLVGIISVTRDSKLKRYHKALLHGMFVKPEYRGKGVGKDLFEKVLNMAKEIPGLEEIHLIVNIKNKNACDLYQKFGFKIVWEEKHALKLDARYVDAYHMTLNLLEEN